MNKTKRRTFSAPQKAEAVRKHLKDRTPVSQIADPMHVQPTMIHNWINTALQQIEHAFESPKTAKAESSKQDAKLKKLKQKLDVKNEVIAELMEENIRSKKENGELEPVAALPNGYCLTRARDQIVDYINYWTGQTKLPAKKLLGWLGLALDVVTISQNAGQHGLGHS